MKNSSHNPNLSSSVISFPTWKGVLSFIERLTYSEHKNPEIRIVKHSESDWTVEMRLENKIGNEAEKRSMAKVGHVNLRDLYW